MTDEPPGDYDSLGGMKERAIALGNPIIPKFIERAEDRLVERDDGYSIEVPETDDPNDAEMLFHFGILAGAALEREYPAPGESDDKAFPAHLQGVGIGLSMGTLSVLGARFHFAIIGLAIALITVSYVLDRLQRGES